MGGLRRAIEPAPEQATLPVRIRKAGAQFKAGAGQRDWGASRASVSLLRESHRQGQRFVELFATGSAGWKRVTPVSGGLSTAVRVGGDNVTARFYRQGGWRQGTDVQAGGHVALWGTEPCSGQKTRRAGRILTRGTYQGNSGTGFRKNVRENQRMPDTKRGFPLLFARELYTESGDALRPRFGTGCQGRSSCSISPERMARNFFLIRSAGQSHHCRRSRPAIVSSEKRRRIGRAGMPPTLV